MNTNKYPFQFFLAAIALALAALPVKAQLQSKVILVNGGLYESVPPFTDYVTVALYDPSTRQYTVKDTIPDQSVQDLEIVGDTAIVVTDNGISTYRLPNLEPISRNGGVRGIRNIIAVGSRLYGARGFGSLPGESYVYIFDRNTLDKTGEIAGIPTECDDIVLANGSLYVSMPGDFGSDTGSILIINPASNQLDSVIRYGTNGAGIGKLAVYGTTVSAFVTGGFGSTSSIIINTDWVAGTSRRRIFQTTLGYTPPLVVRDTVYAEFGGALSKFNYYVDHTGPIKAIRRIPYAGLAIDTLRNQFYVSEASFLTSGKLYTMTRNGVLRDSIPVGIAPEKVAVFYQRSTAINKSLSPGLGLAPNPASSRLTIHFDGLAAYAIQDLTGRTHLSGTLNGNPSRVSVSSLPPGVYNLTVQSAKGYAIRRFVKI